MAITSIPHGFEPLEPEEEEVEEGGVAAEPVVPLRVAYAAPSSEEESPAQGEGSPHAPQWPDTGWASQPGRVAPHAARATKQVLGPTGAVVAACAVVLGGLVAWGAYDGFSNHGNHAWETVPQGQPYYLAHAENVVVPPSIAGTAKAVAEAKLAAKENPMVVTSPSTHVVVKVNPPPLGARYNESGQLNADFAPSYFAVPAGKTIHMTIYNYDTMRHTFTSPALGLNVWLHTATGSTPGKTTFTFKAPKSGYYEWFCDVPCDSYSMSHGGYMEGEIHAVKA